MSSSRAETLKNLVEKNPSDTFARYGLAMEYINSNQLAEAMEQFDAVLQLNANYAAAYFHGGQTLEKLGKDDAARTMYQRGIDVTTRTGDAHTRSELQAALDILG